MGSILGSKVRCKLTGFTGVVTVTIKYLHGSDRPGVQSLELKTVSRPILTTPTSTSSTW